MFIYFYFSFPDRKSIVFAKKIDLEILKNVNVFRSQESKKCFFF